MEDAFADDEAVGKAGDAGMIPEARDSNHPRLGQLHIPVCQEEGAVLMEGGAKHLMFDTKAAGSSTYPFRTRSHLLFMKFVTDHQVPRVMLAALLYMLRFKDPESGEGFDINDLDGVQAEHFVARTRDCMPLYEVYKRDVRCSTTAIAAGGDDSTSVVYDVPANLIIERQLKAESSMKTFLQNPGGKQLSDQEAIDSNLASKHIFCGPERRLGNKRHGNMNGVLARSTPHFGYDDIAPAGAKGRTIHVNDVAMIAAGTNSSVTRTVACYRYFGMSKQMEWWHLYARLFQLRK